MGVRRSSKGSNDAIAQIPEDAWESIEYTDDGQAQVAERVIRAPDPSASSEAGGDCKNGKLDRHRRFDAGRNTQFLAANSGANEGQ